MSAEERAEKFRVSLIAGHTPCDICAGCTDRLAAEIRAAVEEQIEHALKMMKVQRKMAKAEAYEAAAKIAEEHEKICDCEDTERVCGFVIRTAIRARGAK